MALHPSLTKAELLELLEPFDDDQEVMFAYNYGDHWNTQVAQVPSDANLHPVVWSEYHRMWRVVEEEEEDEEDYDPRHPDAEPPKKVIILA